MAPRTSKASAGTTPDYDPETLYAVTLARPVQLPWGDWLLPAHGNQLKGKLLADLGDAVTEAVPVAPIEPVPADG